ncbi:MAG: SPFH domain-containing protein [Thermoguttaceae bacterium]|nr:SPFH domain-containing protein [Thermoguttaceae bacterium]
MQTLLAALAAWIALNSARLRRGRAEAEGIVASGTEEQADAARRQWLSSGDREVEQTYHSVMADVEHGRRLHYLFVAVLPTAVVTLLIGAALFARGTEAAAVTDAQATALGILCLAVSCLWLVLARSFGSISADELPDSHPLMLALRESQWTSILASAGLFSQMMWADLDWWISRIVLAWLLAVAVEQLARLLWLWLGRRGGDAPFLPPLVSLLRELVFVRGNPVASLFETIETHWGVSFRSSWAIRFVRRALVPTGVMALLMFWGLSCLSMVGPSELGLRETFGQLEKVPLQPGLHLKLPWPLGRIHLYKVKRVQAKAIGFIELDQPTAYLWTNRHAEEEFALVLGDGAEAVVVNAVVYYKIREDHDGFLDYALRFQNPDDALEGFGYRALMELTRNSTVREVLATNRAEFAAEIERLMREYAEENRLGIDVVDLALFSLHPPIEAAPDYLEVVSARIDADRYVTEAKGERLRLMEESAAEGAKAIAEAKVEAARRVGKAIEESAEFVAVGQAYGVAPEAFELRLRGDVVQETLENRPVILMDKSFTIQPGEFFFDFRGSRNEEGSNQGVR